MAAIFAVGAALQLAACFDDEDDPSTIGDAGSLADVSLEAAPNDAARAADPEHTLDASGAEASSLDPDASDADAGCRVVVVNPTARPAPFESAYADDGILLKAIDDQRSAEWGATLRKGPLNSYSSVSRPTFSWITAELDGGDYGWCDTCVGCCTHAVEDGYWSVPAEIGASSWVSGSFVASFDPPATRLEIDVSGSAGSLPEFTEIDLSIRIGGANQSRTVVVDSSSTENMTIRLAEPNIERLSLRTAASGLYQKTAVLELRVERCPQSAP